MARTAMKTFIRSGVDVVSVVGPEVRKKSAIPGRGWRVFVHVGQKGAGRSQPVSFEGYTCRRFLMIRSPFSEITSNASGSVSADSSPSGIPMAFGFSLTK